MNNLDINIIGGGVTTVASRQADGEWRCTALQFDLVGTGATKEAAFEELKELVCEYISHISRQRGKVAYFNPSDREEWEVADKKDYMMVVATIRPKRKANSTIKPLSLSDLGSIKNVEKIDLVPAYSGQ